MPVTFTKISAYYQQTARPGYLADRAKSLCIYNALGNSGLMGMGLSIISNFVDTVAFSPTRVGLYNVHKLFLICSEITNLVLF
jgi:hypothetical protein